MAELRDGTRFPAGGDVIPLYIRPLAGGTLALGELRPGVHSFCLAPVAARGAEETGIAIKCSRAKLDDRPQQTLDLIVPASLLAPRQP